MISGASVLLHLPLSRSQRHGARRRPRCRRARSSTGPQTSPGASPGANTNTSAKASSGSGRCPAPGPCPCPGPGPGPGPGPRPKGGRSGARSYATARSYARTRARGTGRGAVPNRDGWRGVFFIVTITIVIVASGEEAAVWYGPYTPLWLPCGAGYRV